MSHHLRPALLQPSRDRGRYGPPENAPLLAPPTNPNATLRDLPITHFESKGRPGICDITEDHVCARVPVACPGVDEAQCGSDMRNEVDQDRYPASANCCCALRWCAAYNEGGCNFFANSNQNGFACCGNDNRGFGYNVNLCASNNNEGHNFCSDKNHRGCNTCCLHFCSASDPSATMSCCRCNYWVFWGLNIL